MNRIHLFSLGRLLSLIDDLIELMMGRFCLLPRIRFNFAHFCATKDPNRSRLIDDLASPGSFSAKRFPS
jgi:hypothetical protein